MPSPPCPLMRRRHFTLIKEQSQFVDWQRVKVQENASEVPAGSLPRTIDVIMRQQAVETVSQGRSQCDILLQPVMINRVLKHMTLRGA